MIYRLLNADVLAGLRTMADQSFQCTITSPPYWGLRDYGIEPSVWDGDASCSHEWGTRATPGIAGSGINGDSHATAGRFEKRSLFCSGCGAWRGCLGLEPTTELYVQHIVDVFREVRRVMRDDGTLWLNLGDCYATGAGAVGNSPGGGVQGERWKRGRATNEHGYAPIGPMTQPNRLPQVGLKPKDLVGIPWAVAFALRADGWWLRQCIIWSKPNPMPESVRDRPTTAHEYIFLLAKSEHYF